MAHRYSLRFETTERRGETIPITGQRFTIGRRPGNSMQILENSVSGKHAEILIEPAGALLRDLGSTNGCRVGAERVLEIRLAPGSELHIGNVGLRFLDAEATDLPSLSSPEVPRGELPSGFDAEVTMAQHVPEELRISAETVERAKKSGSSSKLGLLVMIGLVALAGGAGWYLTQGGGEVGGERLAPVVEPEGNLLSADYSFEAETPAWEVLEGAPASFMRDRAARQSGEVGISVQLAPGEHALHASRVVKVSPGRELLASGLLRSGDGAIGRIGIEFSRNDGTDPISAWSAASAGDGEFGEVSCGAVVPDGYQSARVLVLASAASGTGGASDSSDPSESAGFVDADDVALIQGASKGPTHHLDDYKVYALDGQGLALFKVSRPLMTSFELRAKGEAPAHTLARLAIEPGADGFQIDSQDEFANELVLWLSAEASAGGIATIAAGGYSAHSVDFEREAVTDLLVGSGYDLFRLSFERPITMRGRREGEAFRLAAGGVSTPIRLQLRFEKERAEAGRLAAAAQGAEREGRLGLCLQRWRELLDRYPFEERLTSEANLTRARLLRVGRDEVSVVAREIERARFFRLRDLYRECLDKCLAIEARYTGSEIEAQASEVSDLVRAELTQLEAELDREEVRRLDAIVRVLEAQSALGLASEVREYRNETYGDLGGERDNEEGGGR